MIKNFNFGFTLAEVLITLGVIGVIAAMTLPTVIKNYQKQVTVNKLKKAYISVSNAVQMSKTVNGEVKDWDIKFDNKLQSASDFADKYLIPYMKVVKKCGINQTGDCYHAVKYLNGIVASRRENSTSFYTNDGILYIVGNGINGKSIITTSYLITIDINGNNPPNVLGKDVFMFQLYVNEGIIKANFGESSNDLNKHCKSGASGYSCSAKIIRDGWKIADDYPW